MFGTLVVCLPSQFSNGNLVLSHRGVVQKFDWGSAIQKQKDPNQLHWAAFFGDVDHQIERISITRTHAFRANTVRLTRNRPPLLKGLDHLVAATTLQAGLKVQFVPYMFENCADATWQFNRFPTPIEQSKLGWQVDESDLKRVLPIRASSEKEGDFGVTWLEPPPSSGESTWYSQSDRDPDLPAAAYVRTCDYCPWGYFGNESSEVDFYTYAALHIEIPRFDEGVRAVAKSPKRAKAPSKRPVRKTNKKQK